MTIPEPGTGDAPADGGNSGVAAGARYSFRLHDQTVGRDQAQVRYGGNLMPAAYIVFV